MHYKISVIGAVAGAIATLIFTWIHELMISNIWNTLSFMLLAGALCGILIAWSYFMLVKEVRMISWLMYNLIFFLMFILLGVLSVFLFDPVTTVAELIVQNKAPTHLLSKVTPLLIVFLFGMTLIIGIFFKANWKQYLAVLITCFVLIIFLGTNVAIIGLVDIPTTSFYLVLNFFLLQLALAVVYAVSFWVLAQFVLSKKR
jgi:hypothetical protein